MNENGNENNNYRGDGDLFMNIERWINDGANSSSSHSSVLSPDPSLYWNKSSNNMDINFNHYISHHSEMPHRDNEEHQMVRRSQTLNNENLNYKELPKNFRK